MYRITKRFTAGLLAGLTITEVTSVEFKVGFTCPQSRWGSAYVIEAVERI